jgi:hypothetical protein
MSLNLNFPDNGWDSITQNWSAWWVDDGTGDQ